MSTAIASLKFLLFLLACLVAVPLQIIVMLFTKGPGSYVLPKIWHKAICLIFNIKIKVNGTPRGKSAQTIYVSNHLSYLDTPALGSILHASFVAKSDVSSWPVFGFLSNLQQTGFISRSRQDAQKGKQTLDIMLNDGKSLIIFPEGTSTDGREVLPFKSSLFAVMLKDEHKHINIQPATISINLVNKKEVKTQEDRDIYAWHINMETPLAEHLWLFAKSKGANLSITFHEPVDVHEYSDRKVLAKACHKAVSNG